MHSKDRITEERDSSSMNAASKAPHNEEDDEGLFDKPGADKFSSDEDEEAGDKQEE